MTGVYYLPACLPKASNLKCLLSVVMQWGHSLLKATSPRSVAGTHQEVKTDRCLIGLAESGYTHVSLAKVAVRRELHSWHRETMVTDSKYIRLHAVGRAADRQ